MFYMILCHIFHCVFSLLLLLVSFSRFVSLVFGVHMIIILCCLVHVAHMEKCHNTMLFAPFIRILSRAFILSLVGYLLCCFSHLIFTDCRILVVTVFWLSSNHQAYTQILFFCFFSTILLASWTKPKTISSERDVKCFQTANGWIEVNIWRTRV